MVMEKKIKEKAGGRKAGIIGAAVLLLAGGIVFFTGRGRQ